ncbi:hypothetical protein CR492_01685 [Methylocella silvestris]|uniref:Uncharacterized protein n=2 Tax=Methylocella silvestris TaxID=199596 RepID=A0A2J7TLK5_METSI|nr:hypothetical protein CR492_01685 [Methylocella silvestris]
MNASMLKSQHEKYVKEAVKALSKVRRKVSPSELIYAEETGLHTIGAIAEHRLGILKSINIENLNLAEQKAFCEEVATLTLIGRLASGEFSGEKCLDIAFNK